MGRPVTIEKAAEETGFSKVALQRKIQRGELPYYLPFGGGKIVLDLDELQRLMLQNRVETNEERQEKASRLLQEMNKKYKNKGV